MKELSDINKRYASFLMYLLLIYLAWFIATVLLDNLLMRSWLQNGVGLIINAIRILIMVMGIQSAIFIYDFIFWLRNRKNYKLALNFYVLWLLMFLSALFGGLFWGTGGMVLAGPIHVASVNIYVCSSLAIITSASLIAGMVFIIKIAIHKISIISGPTEGNEPG